MQDQPARSVQSDLDLPLCAKNQFASLSSIMVNALLPL